MFPPKEVYQHNLLCEIVVYDLRVQGNAERLRRERDAWGEYAKVEILGARHVALLLYPGGAKELTV